MSDPRISVVIPTRDRCADLKTVLAALLDQDYPAADFEIIVCDDGSTEDVRAALPEAAATIVRYVRSEPRGPAAARNLGIRAARAPIVAMTDSDTIPDRRGLSAIALALESNPTAVGVEGKVFASNAGEYGPLGEGPTNITGGVYLTCNCAYRKDVLYAIGGFDERFVYPAFEDVDLAARALERGSIVWAPDAVVIHPQRRLTARGVLKKLRHWPFVLLMGYRYGYLGWKRYPVRHPRLRVALLSVIALPAAKLRTAARELLRSPRVAFQLMLLAIIESAGALFLVIPQLLVRPSMRARARPAFLPERAH